MFSPIRAPTRALRACHLVTGRIRTSTFSNLLPPTSHTSSSAAAFTFIKLTDSQRWWSNNLSIQSQSTNSLRRCHVIGTTKGCLSFLNCKGPNRRTRPYSLVSLLGPGLKTQRRKSANFVFDVQHKAGMTNKWRWVENKSVQTRTKGKENDLCEIMMKHHKWITLGMFNSFERAAGIYCSYKTHQQSLATALKYAGGHPELLPPVAKTVCAQMGWGVGGLAWEATAKV